MTPLSEWILRLWGTLRPGRNDRDLEQELRLHLELAAEDARRRGQSAERGTRDAAIRAGGTAQAMEALRDQRGLPWLADLARDVRYGCRLLARDPALGVVASLSLAIGIGANCAVFSFADAVLLRPLTVPRPGEVVTVGSTAAFGRSLVGSYREYVDIRDHGQSFTGLVAFTSSRVAFAATPQAVRTARIGAVVSGNLFTAMGVEPTLGRAFRPEEDEAPGRDPVVILGHAFWTEQFGADPSVLGRALRLNGIDFTVIGVAPASFTGLDQYTRFEFFAPLMMWERLMANLRVQPYTARDFRSLTIKGRLKPGVSLTQAQMELATIATDWERAYPDTNRNRAMTVRSELQARLADAPSTAWLLTMLTTLSAAVLFVACSNVAGLLASRAPVRAREIAVRLAIGAGRLRLVRQLVTESALIAAIGGVLGLGVGYAGVLLFRQFQFPTDLPIVVSFELDRRALMFSSVVALLSAVLVGVGPALRSTRADLTAVMKAGDATSPDRRRRWGRAGLVVGQVAVSVIVLVTASVTYRSFHGLLAEGPGYRTDHLLQMSFDPTLLGYSEAQAQAFFAAVAEQARAVPGVKSVALASSAPSDIDRSGAITIVPEGFELPAGTEGVGVLSSTIDEHYFDTLGLPLVRGRSFRDTDSLAALRVAAINEHLAQRYWPGQDPIGRRFRLKDGAWLEIVAVAKTAKYIGLGELPRPFVYLPYQQRPQSRMTLLVESVGDPASLMAPLREMVRGIDANQPIYYVRTLEESYRMRMVTILDVIVELVAAMGVMGLGIAIVGLYGLVSYAASRRTREIGIRMAIGADQPAVLRMVLRQGFVLAVAGLGVGLLAGEGVRRGLAAAFPAAANAHEADVVALALVGTAVLAGTLLAAYLPARRAARMNPMESLRYD